MFIAIRILLCLICTLCSGLATAEPLAIDLNEQVIMLPKLGATSSTQLETTIFRPPGNGPFPLVVINHGKDPDTSPHLAPRARFLAAARALVKRGFVVALPMRQGFAASGGEYVSDGCDIAANGLDQAQDIVATLDFLVQLSYVDAHRIIVMGQSHGGLATLAFGTHLYPGVLGLVNFAGGLRKPRCPGWEDNLVHAFAVYGQAAQYPSLWFYGDNDQFWSPEQYRQFFASYTGAGGAARLVAFGNFGDNAHALLASPRGLPIWLPEAGRFFESLGLDFSVKPLGPNSVSGDDATGH